MFWWILKYKAASLLLQRAVGDSFLAKKERFSNCLPGIQEISKERKRLHAGRYRISPSGSGCWIETVSF